MTTPLRIAHAITPAPVGGLESVVHLLASAQRARGHSVHVIATLDDASREPALLNALRSAGVPVTSVIAPGRAYVSEWRAVAEALAHVQPSVVHTHGYRADLLVAAAARRAGATTITTLHGFIGGDWKLRLYENLQRRSLHRFDAVVAVSARMASDLAARVDARRLHVVPNAFNASGEGKSRVQARSALGIPGDRFELGWVGRMSWEKGPDVMLRALAEPGAGNAHLSFIGDGADRHTVEQLAAALGVAGRVTFHGVRHDAPSLFRAFDAVVLSSRTEGTPIVLLEAMAARTPVIATSVGGIPDVVQAEHALVVPPDQPAAIAAAIAAVRADPAAASARAARAAARLHERYAVDPWVDAYDRIYRGIAHLPEPLVA